MSSRLRAVGILRLSASGVVCLLGLAATGCVQKEFQDVKAQSIIAGSPIHLDAEQVSLNLTQFECGVQYDLWDPPGAAAGERTSARLEQAGRELHFDDDVVVSEKGFHTPYVQVRGDFMMQLAATSVRDDGPDGRLVEGKLFVTIPHMCFSDPLPVLGVRKGAFTQDALPVLQFRLLQDGWHFTKLIH
jgi:hypothetical protein